MNQHTEPMNSQKGYSNIGPETQECAAPKEDYATSLGRAKARAEEVANALSSLIGSISGPEPAKILRGNAVEANRSLKDALEHTPGEIGESCHVSLKRIEEIRQLLRL